MESRLKNYYSDIISVHLKSESRISNIFLIPRIVKVSLNVGTKNILRDVSLMKAIYKDLMLITGRRSFFTKAKKSISNFKLRKDTYIGLKLTLRGTLMYEFLDRLINIVLPKIRDFKGFSEYQFDDMGNFSFGISEQTVFPELSSSNNKESFGMNISVVTSSSDIIKIKHLLKLLNFPFLD